MEGNCFFNRSMAWQMTLSVNMSDDWMTFRSLAEKPTGEKKSTTCYSIYNTKCQIENMRNKKKTTTVNLPWLWTHLLLHPTDDDLHCSWTGCWQLKHNRDAVLHTVHKHTWLSSLGHLHIEHKQRRHTLIASFALPSRINCVFGTEHLVFKWTLPAQISHGTLFSVISSEHTVQSIPSEHRKLIS